MFLLHFILKSLLQLRDLSLLLLDLGRHTLPDFRLRALQSHLQCKRNFYKPSLSPQNGENIR